MITAITTIMATTIHTATSMGTITITITIMNTMIMTITPMIASQGCGPSDPGRDHLSMGKVGPDSGH